MRVTMCILSLVERDPEIAATLPWIAHGPRDKKCRCNRAVE